MASTWAAWLKRSSSSSTSSSSSDCGTTRDLEDRGSSSSSRGGVKRSASRLAVRRLLGGGGEVAVVGMGVLLRVLPRVVGAKPGRLDTLGDIWAVFCSVDFQFG